jgi:hypothetical protein
MMERCPFIKGDRVVYAPPSGAHGHVAMTGYGRLIAGNTYIVARVDDGLYVIPMGFEHATGGGLIWTFFVAEGQPAPQFGQTPPPLPAGGATPFEQVGKMRVTWQLAGVVLAVFVGFPMFILLVVFAMQNDPTPLAAYIVVALLGIAAMVWGGFGVVSRYQSQPTADHRGVFVKRMLQGAGLMLLGAAIPVATVCLGNDFVRSIGIVGIGPAIWGLVMVAKTMAGELEI